MARRRIFVRLAIGLLAAIVMLGVAGAAASPERASVGAPTGPQIGLEFGDAPEGLGVLAYPPLPVPGSFPTCMSAGPGAWVQHTNFGAHFGPTFDLEADGNAGLCQSSTCFPPYDADECYKDNDAGLILPEPFTIVTTGPSLQIVSCPASKGTALGYACQTAFWGGSVDIDVTNNMPSGTVGRVNLLVDWNQDGQWSGSVTCPDGTVVPEHVLVNFPVPNGFTGPLSKLFPPNFVIGPNTGHIWSRFSITERDVLLPWSGDGQFEDGKSEDYLLAVDKMPEGVKWVQPPSRTLSGLHAHDYVNVTGQHEQITLADDWLCQGGQVTDLHWWGNYELDATQSEHRGAGIDHFHLSIHATDPTGACLPVDPPLWIADVPFGLVAETDTGLVNVEGSKIYKYSYVLPEPFDQIAGHAYWLDITAVSVDPKDPPSWRWQEAARATNPAFAPNHCGTVQRIEPSVPGAWKTISWGQIEPIRFSDMAFEVTSAEPEPEQDLGDAPGGASAPGYPTLLLNNGARHLIVPGGPFMGVTVDPEPDGQPNGTATGDDTDADGDDEDGVTFAGPLRWGAPNAWVWIDMSNSTAGCKINAWIDFNADRDWIDAGEQIITDGTGTPGGTNGFSFVIPGTPPFPTGPTFARFRCSTLTGLGPAGMAPDGEVEDYQVFIEEPMDWGDAPDPSYPTLSASNGAFHTLTPNGPVLGALVDAEPDGQPNATATGDDVSNLADEDGVVFASLLLPGQQACVNAGLSPTGPPGVLFAWIDFDHSGVWGDGPGEQILAGVAVNPGPNVGLCFPVPALAQPGATFARFRLISPIAVPLPPTGPAPDGEVEDYQVAIEAVKWDQPPVLNPESPHPNCYWGWDEPSVYGGERIVADDWKCSDSRPVTDIHWWGSYDEWDEKDPPQIAPASFHIGIWTDVPGPGFSHPGMMIWQTVVPRLVTQERAAGCDFHPPMQAPDTCFLYSYKLPRAEWFYQDPDQNQVYWISISAMYNLPEPPTAHLWGWKTRPRSVIDAAVRIKVPTAPQLESRFEIGEPILDFGEPWDMAFVLTTPAYDYGDAPDANYQTLLASDGARHIHWPNGPFMGAGVDTEGDGKPGPPALGDDNNATDDEDGVTFHGPWVISHAAMFSVDMQLSPVACNLNAWLDFNANGSWEPGERVATDVPLAAGLVHSLSFPIPPYATAVPGITYARFRCSSQAGLGPAGEAPDGEVEDYRVELLAPPMPPVVTTSIVDADTLRLSWPKVTLDIHSNLRLADGYRIYWNSSPYWTPLPGSQWMSQWEGSPPSLPNPVTQDADHLGAPSMHHFYIVRAVYTDIWGSALESADSNREGEFEFTLVPGAP